LIEPLKTSFASAERSSQEKLLSLSEYLKTQDFLIQAFNAIPDVILVLDRNRQIIFANKKAVGFLGTSSLLDLIGKRPGEAIGCVHATDEENSSGCGTTRFCRQCGAVRSILVSQGGNDGVEECSLFARGQNGEERALNFRVWSVPFRVGEEDVTVVTIRDIVAEKRLDFLERTFFHDVLNCAGILKGYSENLRDGLLPQDVKSTQKILTLTQRMIDMIQMQRILVSAEQGDLPLKVELLDVCRLLEELRETIAYQSWGYEQKLSLDCVHQNCQIASDKILLERVLMNLIKNAFEANAETGNGEGIVLKYEQTAAGHLFSVHNSSVIPDDVQLKIFERAFSTKGRGRGLGLYSVKLFTEQYLGGKVFFRSYREQGTTFFVQIPIRKVEARDG